MISMLFSNIDNFTIPSLGTIKTIGVECYSDPDGENRTEAINWNTIWIGTSSNTTLYIRSISNHRITLTLNATDWVPTNISDYMSLSWDYDGTRLNPGETIKVTVVLETLVSSSFIRYLINDEVQNFNFDIHIIANESS